MSIHICVSNKLLSLSNKNNHGETHGLYKKTIKQKVIE